MSFAEHLTHDERNRLRAAVRRVIFDEEGRTDVPNRECDQIIEAFGPETLDNILRRASKAGLGGKTIILPGV